MGTPRRNVYSICPFLSFWIPDANAYIYFLTSITLRRCEEQACTNLLVETAPGQIKTFGGISRTVVDESFATRPIPECIEACEKSWKCFWMHFLTTLAAAQYSIQGGDIQSCTAVDDGKLKTGESIFKNVFQVHILISSNSSLNPLPLFKSSFSLLFPNSMIDGRMNSLNLVDEKFALLCQ